MESGAVVGVKRSGEERRSADISSSARQTVKLEPLIETAPLKRCEGLTRVQVYAYPPYFEQHLVDHCLKSQMTQWLAPKDCRSLANIMGRYQTRPLVVGWQVTESELLSFTACIFVNKESRLASELFFSPVSLHDSLRPLAVSTNPLTSTSSPALPIAKRNHTFLDNWSGFFWLASILAFIVGRCLAKRWYAPKPVVVPYYHVEQERGVVYGAVHRWLPGSERVKELADTCSWEPDMDSERASEVGDEQV